MYLNVLRSVNTEIPKYALKLVLYHCFILHITSRDNVHIEGVCTQEDLFCFLGEYEMLCPGGPGFKPNNETLVLEGKLFHMYL